MSSIKEQMAIITREIIEKLDYKCCWLTSSRHTVLVNRNQPSKTILPQHLKRMENYLESTTCVDGVYNIHAIPTNTSKDSPLVFQIRKGSDIGMSEPIAVNNSFKDDFNMADVGFKNWAETMQENARLKAENESLSREIARLEARLEHLEETNDTLREGMQKETLAAGPVKPIIETLSEIFVGAAPIIQTYLESRKPAEPAGMSEIIKAINAISKQNAAINARLDSLSNTPPPPAPERQSLTIEQLADLVIEGDVSEAEALKMLEGQPIEVMQQFHNLIYEQDEIDI